MQSDQIWHIKSPTWPTFLSRQKRRQTDWSRAKEAAEASTEHLKEGPEKRRFGFVVICLFICDPTVHWKMNHVEIAVKKLSLQNYAEVSDGTKDNETSIVQIIWSKTLKKFCTPVT